MEASSGAKELAHDFFDGIGVGLSQIRGARSGHGAMNASFPKNGAIVGLDELEVRKDSDELP